MNSNNIGRGFSFKRNIINKATDEQLSKLGRGWIWADGGDRHHLKDCLTVKGWAATGGHWSDGWKNSNKGNFIAANYIFLDFDGKVKLQNVMADPFIQQHAAFIYTTFSHGIKSGDRFRVVFETDEVITSLSKYNSLISLIKRIVPGSDDAINGVSCLFGCDRSTVYDFPDSNYLVISDLDQRIQDEQERAQRIRQERTAAAGSVFDGSSTDTGNNLRRWLCYVPNDDYDQWVKVGSWIKSVVASGDIADDEGLGVFTDWSIANYEGVKHRRDDAAVITDLWDGLEGGRVNEDTGEFIRANGLIKIRRLYHAAMAEQLSQELSQ